MSAVLLMPLTVTHQSSHRCSPMLWAARLALVMVTLLCPLRAQGYLQYFNSEFGGDGTYYGNQAGSGHCSFQFSDATSLQWTRGLTGPLYVALNRPQYYDETGACAACGMCIAMYGEVENAVCTTCGPTVYAVRPTVQYVMVADECPECPYGNLDQGADGDGLWGIHWHPVQCNVANTAFHYAFQGSNDYYLKVTITNTRVPVAALRMKVNGSPTYTTLQKTADNYFLLFSAIAIQLPAPVQLTSVLGDVVYDILVATTVTSPPFAGAVQFPLHTELETVGNAPLTTPPLPCGDHCANSYTSARGTPALVPQSPVVVSTPAPTVASTPRPTVAPKPVTTPVPTPAAPQCTIAVAPWTQCGGAGANCGAANQPCADVAWPGSCCASGFGCIRQNQFWWQCDRVTSTGATATLPSTTAVANPASSGCAGAEAVITRGAAATASRAPSPAPSATSSIADYLQCGGDAGGCHQNTTSADPTVPTCLDGAWTNETCRDGFACARWDKHFWQCREVPASIVPTTLA